MTYGGDDRCFRWLRQMMTMLISLTVVAPDDDSPSHVVDF